MQFLTDSAAQMLEPEDDVLQAFMAANPGPYINPKMIAFDQIYLGENTSPVVVDKTLAALAGGADPHTLGQGGLLPSFQSLSTGRQVANTFGSGMFGALAAVKTGEWSGPVRSGYGLHLVRVSDVRPETPADFAAVRDKVLFDWRRAEAAALGERHFQAMKARYVVVTPDSAALEQALAH